jgi:hypothetical protein
VRRLLLLALMLTLIVPLGCASKGWKVLLRVGPGRVETTPAGSRISVIVAVTNAEGQYPDADMVVTLTNKVDSVSTTVTVPANKGTWMGFLFYTDGRAWPTSDVEATAVTPEGKTFSTKRHYDAGGTPWPGPATSFVLDSANRQVVMTVGAVSGAKAYRFWLSRGTAVFDITWGSAFRSAPYADTLSLDSLASGQLYSLWGMATNLDMPALKEGPAALKNVPALATQTLAGGGQFTGLLAGGRPLPFVPSPAEPGKLQARSAD